MFRSPKQSFLRCIQKHLQFQMMTIVASFLEVSYFTFQSGIHGPPNSFETSFGPGPIQYQIFIFLSGTDRFWSVEPWFRLTFMISRFEWYISVVPRHPVTCQGLPVSLPDAPLPLQSVLTATLSSPQPPQVLQDLKYFSWFLINFNLAIDQFGITASTWTGGDDVTRSSNPFDLTANT